MKKINAEFEEMLDFYMEGYDEGKDDDLEEEVASIKQKQEKSVVLLRRKKGHWKSKHRMEELTAKTDLQMTDHEREVIAGMLRSHQVPEITYTDIGTHFDCSVANKKRLDATALKLREGNVLADELV